LPPYRPTAALNPPLELFVQTLDRVRCSCASPLARRQARESEEVVASFFEAIGNRSTLEPPLADEGLAAGLDLLGRRRVDHFPCLLAPVCAR